MQSRLRQPGGTHTLALVKIRDMHSDDFAAAVALNNRNLPALNELDDAELARLVSISAASLTAEVDGVFAGFCVVFAPGADYASLNYEWFSARYDRFVYLDRIAVDPDHRRFGIGKALYKELVDRFTDVAAQLCCEVNVRPRNQASLDFHHMLGFREVGQQDTDGGSKTVSLLAMPLGGG
jgi:uncharacterized protein